MKLKPGSGDAPEIGFLGEHSDPACKNPVTCPEGLEGLRVDVSRIPGFSIPTRLRSQVSPASVPLPDHDGDVAAWQYIISSRLEDIQFCTCYSATCESPAC